MKVHYVHAKVDADMTLPDEAIQQLKNKKVGIVGTIQHLHQLQDVAEQIPNAEVGGQVLGCRADNAKRLDAECILYVGTGKFHPVKIALETEKPVYCFDPIARKFEKLDEEEKEDYEKRKTGRLLRFYNANTVGILVSTKIGQNANKINPASKKMEAVNKLMQREDKEYYIFAFETLREGDLEDFPWIDCWVNTACSRIADGKNMINYDEIKG